MNHTRSNLTPGTTSNRNALKSIGQATSRGIDVGVAMIRIVQIARLARRDEAGGQLTD
jgi:hypothetical protein